LLVISEEAEVKGSVVDIAFVRKELVRTARKKKKKHRAAHDIGAARVYE